MPLVTTEAVVLHGFDYLETSRIIRLATRDIGLLSVLARGARASRRRFGSGLDLFASGVVHVQLRPGRELQQLDGFDLTRSRGGLATSLERFAAASALAELALRFTVADDRDALFGELTAALDAVEGSSDSLARDAGLAGAWRVVSVLGFAPAIDECCRCHAALPGDQGVRFVHAAGGAACAACVPLLPRGRQLPAAARHALRAWCAREAHFPLDEASRRSHVRLLREFLEQHLGDGRPLRALERWERGLHPGGVPA